MNWLSWILGQRITAMIWLTWKAAFRFRLFVVLAVLLLAAVVGLPMVIKDDGTARGFAQILLTYTLSSVTALLGLSTLWLSCGTLARDIEEQQMQVVATKPIARWEVWLGKWLGIVTLDAALLTLAGACICGMLQWRATRLPPDQQAILHSEILVARGSARERNPDEVINRVADGRLEESSKNMNLSPADLAVARQQLRDQVKAQYESLPSGMVRIWRIHLGLERAFLKGKPLQVRVKFNAAEKSTSGTFILGWQVGQPPATPVWPMPEPLSLAPDTFHEFQIPPDLFDKDGVLTIACFNLNNTTLLFPAADSLEVLYPVGGFAANFARGLGIILCWMGLLAAIGLAAASFLSFPVAAFLSLGVLTVSLCSGTLASVASTGAYWTYNSERGPSGAVLVDSIMVPLFRGALWLVNLAEDFSPIDALTMGRTIPWGTLGVAIAQIVLLLGGIAALIGIAAFSRRELASAQASQ
jgi:hypothetical protein